MTLHPNARLTPFAREQIVQRVRTLGWRVEDAAQAAGVRKRTAYRWLARHRALGVGGLGDGSSRPRRQRRRTSARREQRIVRLRTRRLTAAAISKRLGMPRSTVAAVLRRCGLGRLRALDPKPPVRRYERSRPGELLHLDTKKLGRIRGIGHRIHGDRRTRVRGIGWESAHVCVDDHSRLAYVEVLPDEGQTHTTAFLHRAIRWLRRQGVRAERLPTDDGNGYRSTAYQLPNLETSAPSASRPGSSTTTAAGPTRPWATVRP